MKIAVILFIGLLAYTVVASDDDGSSGTAGEPSSAKQLGFSQQRYYQPGYYPRPTRRPARSSSMRSLFSNPILLLLFFQFFFTTTTTAATTTTVATTTAAPITTAAPTTAAPTTASPFAGWVSPLSSNCVYQMQRTQLTSTAAKASCVAMGAKLASFGFGGLNSARRTTLINGVGGGSESFWIDVTGTGDGAGGINTGAYAAGTTSNPATDGITLSDPASSSTAGLCGRFTAGNPDLLVFESCSTNAFYYLCEYCGMIGR